MLATVEDIHHRDRQDARVRAAQIAVQRQARLFSRGARDGQRHTQHGVRADATLVLAAVHLTHEVVDADLVERIEANDDFGELLVDVGDRLEDALAKEALLITITKLMCLVDARRGAGGHGSPAYCAAAEEDLDFDRGISPRIEDFSPKYRLDQTVHEFLRVEHLRSEPSPAAEYRCPAQSDAALIQSGASKDELR